MPRIDAEVRVEGHRRRDGKPHPHVDGEAPHDVVRRKTARIRLVDVEVIKLVLDDREARAVPVDDGAHVRNGVLRLALAVVQQLFVGMEARHVHRHERIRLLRLREEGTLIRA